MFLGVAPGAKSERLHYALKSLTSHEAHLKIGATAIGAVIISPDYSFPLSIRNCLCLRDSAINSRIRSSEVKIMFHHIVYYAL